MDKSSLNQTARRTVVSQTFAVNNRQRFIARLLMLGASTDLLARHKVHRTGGGHFSSVYLDDKDPTTAYKVTDQIDSMYEARVVDREKEPWWTDDRLIRKGDQWFRTSYSREGMDGYAMWAHCCIEARKMGLLPAWAPIIHAAYHEHHRRAVYVMEALTPYDSYLKGASAERETCRRLVRGDTEPRTAIEGAFIGMMNVIAKGFDKITDLHGDNLMQRGPQPVVTDPWAECSTFDSYHPILNPSKKKVSA